MATDVKDKKEIIKEYGKKDTNTGSTEVQVALLTKRINGEKKSLRKKPNIYD